MRGLLKRVNKYRIDGADLRWVGAAICLITALSLLFAPKGEQDAIPASVVNENGPLIALTFDDGPYPRVTGHILDVLEENGVTATFFVLGSRVEGREELLLRMQELGCEVGNHTYTHADLTTLSELGCKREIEDTNAQLRRVLGDEAKVVRPPYGRYNDTVRRSVEYPLILWTVDANDWRERDPSELAAYVVEEAMESGVILLHDQQSSTADAMDIVIPELINAGFRFVTASELIAATEGECKGVKMP